MILVLLCLLNLILSFETMFLYYIFFIYIFIEILIFRVLKEHSPSSQSFYYSLSDRAHNETGFSDTGYTINHLFNIYTIVAILIIYIHPCQEQFSRSLLSTAGAISCNFQDSIYNFNFPCFLEMICWMKLKFPILPEYAKSYVWTSPPYPMWWLSECHAEAWSLKN